MVAGNWCRDNKPNQLPLMVMMRHVDVTRLWGLMRDIGIEAVVRTNTEEAINSLKHGRFTGILIYRDFLVEDPLEVILNVRDCDSAIPVIVVGVSSDEHYERILAARDGVYVLPDVRHFLMNDLPELLSV